MGIDFEQACDELLAAEVDCVQIAVAHGLRQISAYGPGVLDAERGPGIVGIPTLEVRLAVLLDLRVVHFGGAKTLQETRPSAWSSACRRMQNFGETDEMSLALRLAQIR